MSTTQTVPQGKDTAIAGDLYVSLELGDKSWKVTASDGHRSSPSRYNVDAGDTAAVVHCIGKARDRCQLDPQAKMHCCYEAGRDGWWLHRWLIEQGGDNIGATVSYGRWACRCCQSLKQEPAAPEIVDGGIPASGLVAHTLISRFVDHLPYYRQEAINARSGVHTPRSTLAAWAWYAGA